MFTFSCAMIILCQRALAGNTAWVLSHQFICITEGNFLCSYPSQKRRRKNQYYAQDVVRKLEFITECTFYKFTISYV